MKESLAKNKKGILLMLCSALCACTGQVSWKISVQSDVKILIALFGFALYGMGALFMIISYKYGQLSVLQPVQSVNYIFSIFLGAIIFHEVLDLKKVIGVIIIIIGVICIDGGDSK